MMYGGEQLCDGAPGNSWADGEIYRLEQDNKHLRHRVEELENFLRKPRTSVLSEVVYYCYQKYCVEKILKTKKDQK
jgi:hypothetical protein